MPNDPEGNGIEVYADKPKKAWYDANGKLCITNERLHQSIHVSDMPWSGAPIGTRVGHIHLRSMPICDVEQFWEQIGFEITYRYPSASFIGTSGYHHQIAVNRWDLDNPLRFDESVAGIAAIAIRSKQTFLLEDPSGLPIRFTGE